MAKGTIHFLSENPDFEISADKIWARNSGSGATLVVPYRISFSGLGSRSKGDNLKYEVLAVKGELRTQSGILVGYSIQLTNYWLSNSELSFTGQLDFSFGYDVIQKIEKVRKGDIEFHLSVNFQTAIFKEYSNGEKTRDYLNTGYDRASGHIDFTIPQSSWVNTILPQTGYGTFRLIELPATSSVIPSEYAISLGELEEAKKYFLNGDYDKTVAHCRSALDPFKAKKGEIKSYIKSKSEYAWVDDVQTATDEWLNKLVKSTSHFTSKSHHGPSVGHFGRTDAEIIMMVTTSLIAYVGKL